MLPDVQNLKNEIKQYILDRMYENARKRLGNFSGGNYIVHEGMQHCLIRENGEKDDTNFEPFESIIEICFDEIKQMNFCDLIHKVDAASDKLNNDIAEMVFSKIDRICEEKGQVSDANGEGLTGKSILKAIRKLAISFDEKGNPNMPTMYVPGAMGNDVRELIARGASEEEKKEMEDIINMKRLEWYEAEANRRLVG